MGGFSYSEGLESAVDAGRVTDEASAARWLLAQAGTDAGARPEAPLLVASAPERADDRAAVAALNDWVRRTRESAELRAQGEQMGRSLVDWLRNGRQGSDPRIAVLAALAPAPAWPVAFALAGVLAGAEDEALVQAFAFGWAENLVQAAMKAVPLGQAAGQRVLAALAEAIPALAARAAALPADRPLQAFAPGLAVLSARHEAQYSRLFRS
ncbi:MAG: urease accessory UreF family protein [Rubrivivax sp.]